MGLDRMYSVQKCPTQIAFSNFASRYQGDWQTKIAGGDYHGDSAARLNT
jgi:hypothetical protein